MARNPTTESAQSECPRPVDHHYGPSWGLDGVYLALWRCYALTGEDVSQGPFPNWHTTAVAAVAEMREERDRFADICDDIDQSLKAIKDIL